ncbi:MAG: O-antigen ligase family protein [Methylococcaceae bacterium]
MNTNLRFSTLTIIVFCLYVFWGSFGIDLTLHPKVERIPLHRGFILLTAFIFVFNIQQVLGACLKNKLLIALLLYLLLTAAWAFNPTETLKNFVFLSSALFISIMTALAFAGNRVTLIRWLFWLFLLMTLASIITALRFPQIGINSLDFSTPRWIGITTHPNLLGVQGLVLIWLSSNLFFLTKSSLEKTLILFAIIVSLFTIIKADSITSLITSLVIVTYACYCYLFWRLSSSIKIMLFTLSLLSFLFIVTFYMNTSELANTTLASTGRNTTFSGRSLQWQISLTAAYDNLIFGFGFDNLDQLTKKFHINMMQLHNGYIETLVKGGMIASILLTIVLLKTFIHQLKIKLLYKQDFIFLNTGLVMVLLHNITESSILKGLNTLSIFLIFIIVSTSLIDINNKVSHTNQ